MHFSCQWCVFSNLCFVLLEVHISDKGSSLFLCAAKLCLRSFSAGTHTEWRSCRCRGSSIKSVSTLVLLPESPFTSTRVRFHHVSRVSRTSPQIRISSPTHWRGSDHVCRTYSANWDVSRGVGRERAGVDSHVRSGGFDNEKLLLL